MMYDDWVAEMEPSEKTFTITILCRECYKEGRVTRIRLEKRHRLGDDVYVICPVCETPLHSLIATEREG